MQRSDAVQRLLDEVCRPLSITPPAPAETPQRPSEAAEWARSGAMALTGWADGPPRLPTGAPATELRAALDVIAACTGVTVPGTEILGERAAITGQSRRAPWSVGGAFRALPTQDGWFGISLSRESDLDLLPALIERPVTGDPWAALEAWLATSSAEAATARAVLLGLPAASIPAEHRPARRPGVWVTAGGLSQRRRSVPLVVDLTSLWAGPLCARLLGLGGARVVKVESVGRPDGARGGASEFFDLMHSGHESVAFDLRANRAQLRALLGAADVVLEASRPRALRQLGIEAVHYVAAGAIWVSITGYGRDDDNAMRVGFGDDVAAGAGLIGWSDDGQPFPLGDAIADPLAGAMAAAATVLALRGGRGALIDVSMHDVAAAAARAVVPPALVSAQGPGWTVATDDGVAPVAEPWVGESAGRAADFGADTAAIRSEFLS